MKEQLKSFGSEDGAQNPSGIHTPARPAVMNPRDEVLSGTRPCDVSNQPAMRGSLHWHFPGEDMSGDGLVGSPVWTWCGHPLDPTEPNWLCMCGCTACPTLCKMPSPVVENPEGVGGGHS